MEENKIRNRKSFQRFSEWAEFLIKQPRPQEILMKLFDEFDGRNAFGSETQAAYSRESLELVLQDKGLKL